jgi:cadmium resistance transport/sequestration family protein
MITTISTSVGAFIATNLDDIVVLTLFFVRLNVNFRVRQIVLGQYLGFTAILLMSLPGYWGGMLLPEAWIGLLGLLPIAIGLRQLWGTQFDEAVQTVSVAAKPSSWPLSSQTYQVAAVTLANGGDNIGVYVPLFANSSLTELLVIWSTFFALIGLWCLLAFYLAHHPLLAPKLTRYGAALVPYLLIGLGLFILIENRSYSLLPFWHS